MLYQIIELLCAYLYIYSKKTNGLILKIVTMFIVIIESVLFFIWAVICITCSYLFVRRLKKRPVNLGIYMIRAINLLNCIVRMQQQGQYVFSDGNMNIMNCIVFHTLRDSEMALLHRPEIQIWHDAIDTYLKLNIWTSAHFMVLLLRNFYCNKSLVLWRIPIITITALGIVECIVASWTASKEIPKQIKSFYRMVTWEILDQCNVHSVMLGDEYLWIHPVLSIRSTDKSHFTPKIYKNKLLEKGINDNIEIDITNKKFLLKLACQCWKDSLKLQKGLTDSYSTAISAVRASMCCIMLIIFTDYNTACTMNEAVNSLTTIFLGCLAVAVIETRRGLKCWESACRSFMQAGWLLDKVNCQIKSNITKRGYDFYTSVNKQNLKKALSANHKIYDIPNDTPKIFYGRNMDDANDFIGNPTGRISNIRGSSLIALQVSVTGDHYTLARDILTRNREFNGLANNIDLDITQKPTPVVVDTVAIENNSLQFSLITRNI